jgi:16S rRNA (guanine1516-N2)-methyltransferase
MDLPAPLRLLAAGPGDRSEAGSLSAELGLALVPAAEADAFLASGGMLLVVAGAELELRFLEADARQATRVSVEAFLAGAVRRGHGAAGGDDLLLRASGVPGSRVGTPLRVLDATAGFGRDALLLATAGCLVTACERVPVVRLLLERGLQHAAADDPGLAAILGTRLRVLPDDARDVLSRVARAAAASPAGEEAWQFDVVLLDPMHPPRTRSARVRKELRALQRLAGADADAPELLPAALAAARRRVAVKRPTSGPPLAGPAPSRSLRGRRVRYDLYDVAAFDAAARPTPR